jgi:hypothetical protein
MRKLLQAHLDLRPPGEAIISLAAGHSHLADEVLHFGLWWG